MKSAQQRLENELMNEAARETRGRDNERHEANHITQGTRLDLKHNLLLLYLPTPMVSLLSHFHRFAHCALKVTAVWRVVRELRERIRGANAALENMVELPEPFSSEWM